MIREAVDRFHKFRSAKRIRHDRYATTTAGREPGMSLAMHQLAAWRVSKGGAVT
jgi:hypothetical protein